MSPILAKGICGLAENKLKNRSLMKLRNSCPKSDHNLHLKKHNSLQHKAGAIYPLFREDNILCTVTITHYCKRV